jgi:hypothetical protein
MATTQSTIDTIALFKGIASAHNAGLSALAVIKGHIETLRKGQVTIGASKKTCQYRVQLIDAYKAGFPGKSEKTLMNYVTTVADCVNNGTEFSFSASKGKGAKGKGKGEKDTTIFPILAKLFSHEGFAALVSDLQGSYDNDEGSLSDLIRVTLESEGYEIKD